MLLSALQQYSHCKWPLIDLGIAKDDKHDLEAKLKQGLHSADVLITSGGVSMGEYDLLQPLLESYGKIHFGRILMKPGKPLTFVTIMVDNKDSDPALQSPTHEKRKVVVFGLPGNPVSSLVTFQLFCVPALRKMAGYKNFHLPMIKVKVLHALPLDVERPEYHRATLCWSNEDHCFVAKSTGDQRSSRLLSMRSANVLLVLPQGEAKGLMEIPKGEFVHGIVIGDFDQ